MYSRYAMMADACNVAESCCCSRSFAALRARHAVRSSTGSQFAPRATLTELRRRVRLLGTVCTGSVSRLPSAPADRGAGVLHADGPGPLGTVEDGGSEKEGVAATGAGVARAADTRPEVRAKHP
jgi:hypothetical protein